MRTATNQNDNTNKSSDPAAPILAAADRRLGAETPTDPVTAAEFPSPPAAAAPAPAFLTQAVAQLVNKGLILSKLAGWKSPAIPELLSEDEWKNAVASTSVAVIQKRWPTLANDATPEFALVVLTAPWLLENLLPLVIKILFRGKDRDKDRDKEVGKGDRDPRRDGDGKNNIDANAAEPMFPRFPDRPDARPEV